MDLKTVGSRIISKLTGKTPHEDSFRKLLLTSILHRLVHQKSISSHWKPLRDIMSNCLDMLIGRIAKKTFRTYVNELTTQVKYGLTSHDYVYTNWCNSIVFSLLKHLRLRTIPHVISFLSNCSQLKYLKLKNMYKFPFGLNFEMIPCSPVFYLRFEKSQVLT